MSVAGITDLIETGSGVDDIPAPTRSWVWYNTPNIITISRGIAAIAFWIQMLHAARAGHLVWATIWLFQVGAMAVLDIVDGRLARSGKRQSKFGAYMDPLMDKATVFTGLFCYFLLLRSGAPNVELLRAAIALILVAITLDIALTMHATIGLFRNFDVSANDFGKRKFHLQALALTTGYFALYWAGPERYNLSAANLCVVLTVAIYFGVRSLTNRLRGHPARPMLTVVR